MTINILVTAGGVTKYTINGDVFARLDFRASSTRRHICEVKFSHTYQLEFILFVLL